MTAAMPPGRRPGTRADAREGEEGRTGGMVLPSSIVAPAGGRWRGDDVRRAEGGRRSRRTSGRGGKPGRRCQRFSGNPRSTLEVAGSGHRLVTTFDRVKKLMPSGPYMCWSPNSDAFQPPKL